MKMSTYSENKNNCDVLLHAEIELLKNALVDKQTQLIAMETACMQETDRQVELEDSIIAWQDKYDRLYESHKRVQKVNQNLEDKLLKLVDRNANERSQLTSDVATLSVRLAQANYNIQSLQRDISRYKQDMSLAIQLLQCKPDSFIPQKITSLPVEMQSKVANYMRLDTHSHSDSEGSTSGIGLTTPSSYHVLPATSDSPPPICPFPPTAMVYSMRRLDANQDPLQSQTQPLQQPEQQLSQELDHLKVSPSVMAKFLQEELKASEQQHCDTCQCPNRDLTVLIETPKFYNIGTQTVLNGETKNSLCLRCNSNLNSPSRNDSPYIMKLLKSNNGSIMSETKSIASDLDAMADDKLLSPVKKDELLVNPILGHHRIAERVPPSSISSVTLATTPLILSPKISTKSSVKPASQCSHSKMSNDAFNMSDSESFLTNLENLKIENNALLSDEFLNDIKGNEDDLGKTPFDLSISALDTHHTNTNTNSSPSVNGITVAPANSVQQKPVRSGSGSSAKGSNNNLQHGTGNGSTNSLWSKTSSKEGNKMFEHFNRNLIKTIKSENPRTPGPRICALRIQNGSNNILLDNVNDESFSGENTGVTPIVYTRRSKFLDEELDDDKDITTGCDLAVIEKPLKISMVMNNNSNNNMNSINIMSDNNSNNSGNHSNSNTNMNLNNVNDLVNINDSKIPSDIKNLNVNNSQDTIPDDSKNLMNTSICKSLSGNITDNSHLFHSNLNTNYDIKSKLYLQVNNKRFGDKLESDTLNSKSLTQSSSISSELDIQESALLRRQQLSRVAEWVQNNSNIIGNNNNNNNNNSILNSEDTGNSTAISSGGGSIMPTIPQLTMAMKTAITAMPPPSQLTSTHATQNASANVENINNVNSIVASDKNVNEHFSNMLNACKIHSNNNNDIILNGINNSINKDCNDNINNDMYKISDVRKELENQTNFLIAQNINNEQYLDSCNRKKHSNINNNNNNEEQQQVDIAQMEYNVKQFLLKQNEWSIANKRSPLTPTTTTTPVRKKYHRTETNL